MRATLTLDDELIAEAAAFTGIRDRSALINTAIEALLQREAAFRLSRLGGSQPDFVPGPRKRYFDPDQSPE